MTQKQYYLIENYTNKKFGKLLIKKFVIARYTEIMVLCECECGNITETRWNKIFNGLTKSCGKCIRTKNLLGQRFGRLLVIEYFGVGAGGRHQWLCQCDCGNQKNILSKQLISGHTQSCGCYCKQRISESRWTGFEEMSGRLLAKLKNNAWHRNINFNVEYQDIWDKFLEQNRKCSLSGIPIIFTRNTRGGYQTASLDRIDSSKDYVIDNIQWLHKDINQMKLDLNQDEFLYFVHLVCNPILDNDFYNSSSLETKRRSHNWCGYGNMSGSAYRLLSKNAKTRKMIFDISLEYCWDLFVKQNGKCAITGLKLLMSTYKSKIENTASLDRIDSKRGYTQDNVQWVHKNINKMKWDFSQEEFINYCHLVNNYSNKEK